MIINTDQFKQILETVTLVGNISGKKENSGCTDNLLFKEKHVFSYNGEVVVCCPTPFPTSLEGIVPTEALMSFIRKVNDKTMSVEMTEDLLVFRGGKFKAGILLESTGQFPKNITTLVDEVEWTKLPTKFGEALDIVSESAATTPGTVLSFIQVADESITACNNFEVTSFSMKGLKNQILIPATAVKNIVRFSPDSIGFSDKWIFFSNPNGSHLSCRAGTGKYPDVSKLLSNRGKQIEFPETVDDVLARADVFSTMSGDATDKEVKFIVADKKFIIRCHGKQGWFEEIIPSTVEKSFSFSINPEHLLRVIEYGKKIELTETSIMFRDSNFIHSVSIEK